MRKKPDADVEGGKTDAEGYYGIFQGMNVRFGSRCRKLIEFPEHHQYNRAGLP